uniref:Uncharacterized protein n=1 Tax=Solanum tuberosum TaxID=4113 RepID=M1D9Q3_SOLTU
MKGPEHLRHVLISGNFYSETFSEPDLVHRMGSMTRRLGMARPKVVARNKQPQKRARGIVINEGAAPSWNTRAKLPPKGGRGKEKGLVMTTPAGGAWACAKPRKALAKGQGFQPWLDTTSRQDILAKPLPQFSRTSSRPVVLTTARERGREGD